MDNKKTSNCLDDVLYVNFNQDYSCISIGTRQGFRIYNCDPFGKCYQKDSSSKDSLIVGGALICDMLFSSSLVVIVGTGNIEGSSARSLKVINIKRDTIICEMDFSTTVLKVRMNRKRMAVFLEDKIHIYDITTMNRVHSIECAPNINGIGALSSDADYPYLAYPAGNGGDISIFDTMTLRPVCNIPAHKTKLAVVNFSLNGEMLATASDKGTVIRVFSIPKGEKLYQFKRGTLQATIHSLAFDPMGKMLSVTSDSDTIHIFKLEDHSASVADGNGKQSTHHASSSSFASNTSSFLPSFDGSGINRSFARIHLNAHKSKSLCAIKNSSMIMVLTNDGYFQQYAIVDSEKGGECKLIKRSSFNPRDDTVLLSSTSSFD